MEANKIYIVDYSLKAFAIIADFETAFKEEFQAIGGRFNSRLSFGAGWIFSKNKHRGQIDALFASFGVLDIIECVSLSDVETAPKKHNKAQKQKQVIPDYILTADEVKNKYSRAACGVRLSDGVLLINEKEALQTVFWFGYSDCGQGPTEEEANASANAFGEKDFISKNTERLRNALAILKGESELNRHFLLWKNDNDCYDFHQIDFSPNVKDWEEYLDAWDKKHYIEGKIRKMTDEERERLITGYTIALERREKRCEKYLKRYGLSKLSISTYWMDR